MIKIDEILKQQLAASGSDPIEAVVMLQPADGALVPTPEETQKLAADVVARACKKTSANPGEVDFNVFEHMGSFAISAPAEVIRLILKQPEVAGAMANQQERGFAVKPVRGKAAVH